MWFLCANLDNIIVLHSNAYIAFRTRIWYTVSVMGLKARRKACSFSRPRLALLVFMVCVAVVILSGPYETSDVGQTLSRPMVQPWLGFSTCCHFVYEPTASPVPTKTSHKRSNNSHLFLMEFNNPCYLYKDEHRVLNGLLATGEHTTASSQRAKNVVTYKDSVSGALKEERLRCLPHYFVLGWAKSGTTDLHEKMMAHPYILRHEKEPMWFNTFR